MHTFFYLTLFLFGAVFGSFASVIIYRIKSGEGGIITGRSHCNSCNKVLNAIQLIPIFSWIKNKGKCFNCKKKISSVYPFLELSMGFIFTCIGYFLTDVNMLLAGSGFEIIKLSFFLFIGFCSIIYIFYDILFLEIPEIIMSLAIIVTLVMLSAISLLIPIYSTAIIIQAILLSLAIVGGLYLIMLRGFHSLIDVSIILLSLISLYLFKVFHNIELTNIYILNSLIGALGIYIFFFLQIIISKGKWIGGGDLRIAILIGLILGNSLWIAGTMISYFVGTVIILLLIAHNKIQNIALHKKGKKSLKFDSRVPFGPFLGIGFFITLFFSKEILSIIEVYFKI